MAYRKYKRYKRNSKYKKDDTGAIVFVVIVILMIVGNEKFDKSINFLIDLLKFITLIGILFLAFLIAKRIIKYQKQKDFLNKKYSLDELLIIYKNTPTDFEKYISNLYKKLGYNSKVTPPTNDGGKDIIMYKNHKKYFVEVKLYNHHNWIGREALQKFHSACEIGKAEGIFITTSSFKKTAIDWAKKCNIKLINGQELIKLIEYSNK